MTLATALTDAVGAALPAGVHVFGEPVGSADARLEIPLRVDVPGDGAAQIGKMAEKIGADGSEAEAAALASAVVAASSVGGRMAGKVVYVRHSDIWTNEAVAVVALHLERLG